ncbi:MAG: hypothetical protein VYA30_09760 [Myxococcota bacterium]|nr:hypothetical protein [Myxococcota bacterium]
MKVGDVVVGRYLLVAVMVSLAACGASESGSGLTSYDAQLRDGHDMGTAGDGAVGTAESVLSVWERVQVMSGFAELPAFGLQVSETIGFMRTELIETLDGVIARDETCYIEIYRPDVSEVITRIPAAFVNSIPLIERGVVMEDDDAFVIGEAIEVHGVHLVRPRTEALPDTADDPRVFDQDGDGEPGVTVQIDGILEGAVQLVQRVFTRLVGQRREDVIVGELKWRTEERVLAATNAILLMPVNSEINPDPLRSWFVARRIEPSVDCADIKRRAPMILESARRALP